MQSIVERFTIFQRYTFFCFLTCIFFTSTALAQINFSQSELDFNGNGSVSNGVTSLMYGPDGRLYVAEYPGAIKVLTVQRNGATDYVVTATETLDGIQTMADHNDDGSLHSSISRETIGLTVGGTASNPIIYVSSSDFRIGAGTNGGNGDVGLDTNSGVITRFTWNGSSWDVVDIVRGLPRSEENHATNGLELTTINGTNYLIVASGGFTNAGGPSTNFVYTCEYALSGAVLSVDLDAINALPVLDDNGRSYIYDLPTLDDPTRENVNGIADPNDPDYNGVDVNDPWGGNDGLNQAIVVPGGPVQIFSPGYRNAYDLVVTESGALYVTDNGANQGWGGFPINEGGGSATNDYDPLEPGSQSTSGGEQIDNEDHLELVTTNLQTYLSGSFYGGHPNPTRANPNGSGLYTAPAANGNAGAIFRTMLYDPDGSTPGSTMDPNLGLPANWPPVQIANPVEGDWRGPSVNNPDGPNDNPVTIWGTNTNGIDEYTATNFGGAMQGDLLAGHHGGNVRRVELNASGTLQNLNQTFLSGIGGNALGITCNGDTEVFPGTVWTGTLNGKIVVFEPQDFVNCIDPGQQGYDTNADYDSDGYTNQDEEDNGTDPCNGGSQPTDFDKSGGAPLISNLNDTDDDGDGIPDASDPFQLGNPVTSGSDAFTLPVNNDLFNDQQGLGGIFGLGMTGLMNNGNTGANWLDWLDDIDQGPNPNDVLGGAPGLMTSHMTSGTALGATNTQEKGYQYGVQVDQSTGKFVVTGNLVNLNGPLRIYGNTAAVGGELGHFIGDGTQSNYIKMVLTTNGITVLQEINDVPQTPINYPIAINNRPVSSITFYFFVDPTTGFVNLQFSKDGGIREAIGSVSAQGAVLSAIQQPNTDLAVGFIGTSNTGGVELEGTWDFLNVALDNRDFVLGINAGGPEISSEANLFSADAFFSGGQPYVKTVVQTPDLYKTERSAPSQNFQYDIPLTNGDYELKLHFAEIYWGATAGGPGGSGKRVFDVSAEGVLLLDDYDIFAEVGAETPSVKIFEVAVVDGELNLNFDSQGSDGVDQPKVSAIEILGIAANTAPVAVADATPLTGAAPLEVTFTGSSSTDDNGIVSYLWDFGDGNTSTEQNPVHSFGLEGDYNVSLTVYDAEGLSHTDDTLNITVGPSNDFTLRINAGGPALTYNNEQFEADEQFTGGQLYSNSNALVPELYQTERSSPSKEFSYNIPVENGDYTVNLHFADIYFGATGGGPGGVGSRVFDVVGEGELLLDDYDIIADVGTETPVIKTFYIAVGDGELNLNFDALGSDGADQPKVSAIEILQAEFPPLSIDPIANQNNQIGDTISNLGVSASGGDASANFTYSISGQPSGIQIELTNGLIFGTIAPEAATGGLNNDGIHTVVVTVDKPGSSAVTLNFIWAIGNPIWIDKAENVAYEAKGESGFVQAGDKFYVIGGLESQNVYSYEYGTDVWTDLGEAPLLFNHFQPVEHEGLIWVLGALRNRDYPNDEPTEYVWIFDPVENTWTQGPAVPQNRVRGSAGVVLHDDKFYVVGGSTNGHDGGYVPWLDEFDPSTGQWRELPDAPRPRDHFYAASANNKIYAVGGRLTGGTGGFFGPDIPEVDIFDFETETWSTLSSALDLPTPRAGAPVAHFQNMIMVMGGEIDDAIVYGVPQNRVALQITEGFDLDTNSWTRLSDTAFPRHGTNAVVSGEAVYMASGAGGWGDAPAQQNMEFYGNDAPIGEQLVKSDLIVPASLVFPDTQPVQLTLETANGNTGLLVRSMEISGPNASDFSIQNGQLTNGLLKPNTQHGLELLYTGSTSDATALLTINYNASDAITVALEGSTNNNNSVWVDKNENENYTPRHECGFVQAGDRFYLFGGRESTVVDVYDYTNDSWSTSTPSPINLNHFQAIEYQGLIWVIGALEGENFPVDSPADHVWMFDPANEEWIQGPEIPQDRRRGSAGMVLYNDKFYIVGGNTDGHSGGFVPWFDEYDPVTGIWTALADAPNARDHFHAVSIDDKLYAIGGKQTDEIPNIYTNPVLETDVYDFTTNSWSSLSGSANIPTPRSGAGVAIYQDKIMVVGGGLENTDVYGTVTSGAVKITELFDPLTQTWTRLPDANHVRRASQAIVSGDGIYLVSGSDVLLGGTQKNMEYFGQDSPEGEVLAPSELNGPAEVVVPLASSTPILLTTSNGNTGLVVTSMELTGTDASNFSIVNGELSYGLISANTNHELQVDYTGPDTNANAILTINYGASSSLEIDLNVSSSASCTWNELADPNSGRFETLSQVVGDKLYVIGGWAPGNPGLLASNQNDIYDPITDTWSMGAPMPTPVTHMGNTVVGDEIWSVGGFVGNNPGVATNIVQIYNTTTDTWSSGPSLPIPTGSGAMALNNNKLHYFGGLDADRQTDIGNHYVLDLANMNDGWTTAAPLPNPRNHLSGISVDGTIYAIGGQFGHDVSVQDTKLLHAYDPATDQWTKMADLLFERSHVEPGTSVHNGKIIIAGGRQVSLFFDEVTQYDPQLNTWTELCKLPQKLLAPTAKVYNDRLIVTGGGINGFTNFSNETIWLQLDPIVEPPQNWIDKDEDETYSGRHENAFVQAGDKFYLFGGRESSKDIDIYDHITNTWSTLVDSAPFEFNHFQAIQYEGLIWVIGAFQDNNFPIETAATNIWAFDPANEEWIQGPEIPVSRRRGSAGVTVYNDKFYLVGGNTNGHEGGFVPFFDEYDPASGSWTSLIDAPRARDHFNAVVIGNKLYASGGRLTSSTGGYFSSTIAEVDVYDFSTATWTTLPSQQNIPTERAGASAVNFNNDLIVIGGEVSNQTSALATTEQFNPLSGTWTSLPDLNSPRHGTQAIVSGNGIFIASGSPTRGGGNQKNMEVLGIDSPTGSPSVASSLIAPSTVSVNSVSNTDFDLNVSNGNTGILVTSMTISGPNASNFAIESGSLTNGLISANSTHTVSIGYTGSDENDSATLTINYGMAGQLMISLEAVANTISSFTLVDADSDTDLFDIGDGQQINEALVQGIGLNVRANTMPEVVGSVSFELTGALQVTRTENAAVYALFGNSGNDYASVQLPLGDYTLSTSAFSGANQTGTLLGTRTIQFSIVTEGTSNTAPEVTNPGTQNNSEGDTVSLQILASDDGTDLTYGAVGLPPGLSINSNTGLITGTVASQTQGNAFQESNGLVIIEAESGNIVPGWSQTSSGGATGLVAGNNHFHNQNGGTIPYQVNISTPGVYRFVWRSFFSGSNPTEENDNWLRFPNDSNVWFFGYKGSVANESTLINNLLGSQNNIVFPKGSSRITAATTPEGSGSNGYLKVFRRGGTSQTYSWQALTNDGDGHDIYVWFVNAGTYTMEISERSSGHTIDKMALYKLDGQQYTDPQLTAATESVMGGGPGASAGSPYSVAVTANDNGTPPLGTTTNFIWNIGATALKYTLTVNNGNGDGDYTAGTIVDLTANPAPLNQEFDTWIGDVSGIADVNSPSTTLIMPSSDAAVTATYRIVPTSSVIWLEDFEDLTNGTSMDTGATAWSSTRPSGIHEVADGAFVTNDAGAFGTWTSEIISINGTVSIFIDVDDGDNNKEANDFVRAYYILDGGTPILFGSVSDDISPQTFSALDVSGSTIQVVVESAVSYFNEFYYIDNVRVTGESTGVEYTLTVENGVGDGQYAEGVVVNISADPAPANQEFDVWVGDVSGISDVNNPATTLVMPESDATVSATYRNLPGPNVLWFEDFEDLSDGTTVDGGVTAWTSTRPSGVYEVVNGAFVTNDAGAFGTWTSELITITGTISIFMDVDDGDEKKETNDFVRAYYIVDGGTPILFGSVSDDISPQTFSASNISGNTIQIVVESKVSYFDEYYLIDNIAVIEDNAANSAKTFNGLSPTSNILTANNASILHDTPSLGGVIVYPNPTREYIAVSFTQKNVKILNIDLIDLTGKQIRKYGTSEIIPTHDGAQVSIETLRNGVYLLRLDFENLDTKYVKVVVKN